MMKCTKFEKGEKAILDEKFANGGEVEVVYQTLSGMLCRVKDGDAEWDVMTNRLTKILKSEREQQPL